MGTILREIIDKVEDYYWELKEDRLGVWHLKGIKMLREDVILILSDRETCNLGGTAEFSSLSL